MATIPLNYSRAYVFLDINMKERKGRRIRVATMAIKFHARAKRLKCYINIFPYQQNVEGHRNKYTSMLIIIGFFSARRLLHRRVTFLGNSLRIRPTGAPASQPLQPALESGYIPSIASCSRKRLQFPLCMLHIPETRI